MIWTSNVGYNLDLDKNMPVRENIVNTFTDEENEMHILNSVLHAVVGCHLLIIKLLFSYHTN